jgi:hypothetical protein
LELSCGILSIIAGNGLFENGSHLAVGILPAIGDELRQSVSSSAPQSGFLHKGAQVGSTDADARRFLAPPPRSVVRPPITADQPNAPPAELRQVNGWGVVGFVTDDAPLQDQV